MDIVQETLNYDLAIEQIAKLRSYAIRCKHSATSDKEKQKADDHCTTMERLNL